METVIIAAVMAIANIMCFMLGVKVGMAAAKGEPIVQSFSFPKVDTKQPKEAEIQRQKIDTILRNIERYDGTGMGQEDV